jgi:L-fucose isomerase
MIRIGLLSFSDGRERVHKSLAPAIENSAKQIRTKLEASGEFEVVNGTEIIWRHSQARDQARWLHSQNVDGTILNVPVFAFPNLARIASHFAQEPFLAFSPNFSGLPGLGGMLGASNALEQVGIPCEKLYGSLEDQEVLGSLTRFCRAAHAVNGLRGSVLGLIGGRSIGMVTGEAPPDLYDSVFGVDTDHIDQLEIIRRAQQVPDDRVERAFKWLESRTKEIVYDDKKLTPENLKEQIRHYFATQSIIEERQLDFVAVKCHYEMSEYYHTQCLSAAFMNDPYDWDGDKEPFVFACEADADAAMTMQVLKLLSGKPVIFTDLRHYDEANQTMVLCNCGAMSTWYTKQSDDPSENMAEVTLMPVIEKYGGNGCHVRYIAGEGQMTFARLYRQAGQYHMTIFTGETKEFPVEKLDETCPAWPHLFVKLSVSADELIPNLGSNHIHAVAGDYVSELLKFCDLKGIVPELF